MTQPEIVTLLSRVPLFSSFSTQELEDLAGSLKLREFASGEVLMREGESGRRIYILMDGEVEVLKALGTLDERLLGRRSTGTLFGEMSLFGPDDRHTASVRALGSVRALEMTRQDLDRLLQSRPLLAYDLIRQVTQRLEQNENATIRDLREKNQQLVQAYADLKAAQAQLVEKERLEKELAIARQIQTSILPEDLPQPAGYDIAALTFPAREVGGDYYDVFRIKGDRYGLVVGDACDKGIPAALFINLTTSLVHVEALRRAAPEKTLQRVNRHLNQMNRAGMFVTLLYGILETMSGKFEYCRAGHPHPLIFDDAGRPVVSGAASGVPLGVLDEIELKPASLVIPAGGGVVMFSDGLSEAQNPRGEEFGAQRLVENLAALHSLPAKEMCAAIWALVQDFCSGQPQSDDFTILVVKRGGQ